MDRPSIILLVALILSAAACTAEELPAPSIYNVSPDLFCGRDSDRGWVWVEIHGEGFVQTDGTNRLNVQYGLHFLTFAAVANSELILLQYTDQGPVSGLPPDVFDIVLTNPDGQTATALMAITHARSFEITGVDPISGTAGSAIEVTVTGREFYGFMKLSMGNATSDNVEPTSPTSFIATITLPSAPGRYLINASSSLSCEEATNILFDVL